MRMTSDNGRHCVSTSFAFNFSLLLFFFFFIIFCSPISFRSMLQNRI